MDIYEIIGSLLAAFVVSLVAYLAPKFKAWLAANTDSTTEASVLRLIRSFARAAEQLFHDEDPTGAKRNKYVREQLTKLGIEITEMVVAMIEGEVWSINNDNKKAQVQVKALTAGGSDHDAG